MAVDARWNTPASDRPAICGNTVRRSAGTTFESSTTNRRNGPVSLAGISAVNGSVWVTCMISPDFFDMALQDADEDNSIQRTEIFREVNVPDWNGPHHRR